MLTHGEAHIGRNTLLLGSPQTKKSGTVMAPKISCYNLRSSKKKTPIAGSTVYQNKICIIDGEA